VCISLKVRARKTALIKVVSDEEVCMHVHDNVQLLQHLRSVQFCLGQAAAKQASQSVDF
jgi:hypothetical protein